MEYYSKRIPIKKQDIEKIIRSFEDGEYLYNEYEKEHPTKTHNGRGQSIWNRIFTELDKNFMRDGYQVGIIKRGLWEALYIYDENSRYLYTFMRYKNFTNLQNRKPENKLFHYANVLSTLNDSLKGMYQPEYEQISFIKELPLDEDTDKELKKLLNKMVSKISSEIERYVIVTVEQKKGKIEDIQCIIPTFNMDTMYSESWNEFINVHYEDETSVIEPAVEENTEINLVFKQPRINLIVKEKKAQEKDCESEEINHL